MSRTVKLHVYDLSNGLARALSPNLLGKQIDGIWHTGVVIGSTEYFFGGGIQHCHVSETPFGHPQEVITLGETEIPDEMIKEFLDDISPRFNASTYNLLSNNCNNFSDELSQFLVGEHIPSHITGLPAEVAATPFGQMIIPMLQPALEQRLGNVTSSGFAHNTVPAASSIAEAVKDTPQSAAPQGGAAAKAAAAAVSRAEGAQQAQKQASTSSPSTSNPAGAAQSASKPLQAAFNDALQAEFRKVQAEGVSDANAAGAEALKRVLIAVRQGAVMAPTPKGRAASAS